MKHRLILTVLVLWAGLTACSQGGDRTADSYNESTPPMVEAADGVPTDAPDMKTPDQPKVEERKIIRTGSLTFRCSDLQGAHSRIQRLADSLGGYVSRDEVMTDEGRKRYVMEVRVPARHFERLASSVAFGMDEAVSRNLHSNDVTLSYVDLESRIKTKREMEKRYLELLKVANNIPEMMQVEAELGRIRTEVESMEAQFKTLSDQVAFSTLLIEFYAEVPQTAAFGGQAGEAFGTGWNALLRLALSLIAMWPLWFLAVLGWAAIRWNRRHIKNPAGV